MYSILWYSMNMIDMKEGWSCFEHIRWQFLKHVPFVRASRCPKGSWTLQILSSTWASYCLIIVIQQLLTLHDIWNPSLAIELLQGYFWNQTYLFCVLNRCTPSNWSSTRTPGARIGHLVLTSRKEARIDAAEKQNFGIIARARQSNQLLFCGYISECDCV